MSVPRHFNQRPRRRLAPPPQRGVTVPVSRVEEVAEEIAEFIEAAVVEEVEEAPVVEAEVVVEAPVEAVVEPPVVEAAVVEPPAVQTWNSTMKKAELLAIAQGMGLPVSDTDTKAAILEALRAA